MQEFSTMLLNSMSPIEIRILQALRQSKDISIYKGYTGTFKKLNDAGYIKCYFDEQGDVIKAKIAPLGKKIVLP